MQKYKIILNPTSGRGNGEKAIPTIEKMCNDLKLFYDLEQTQDVWHAVELAKSAAEKKYDVIVSVGGDGTANEVLNGIMLAKEEGVNNSAFGVLTVGTGNDFAYGANISNKLEEGCQLLSEDHRHVIDVGKVTGGLFPNGRYFGNGVGIGFDAVVGFEAQKLRRLKGFLPYAIAALKTIFLYYKAPHLQIEFNDQVITQPSLLVSIMNGKRMGGGFIMAPNAENNDGLFDLCIAGSVSIPKMFPLFPKFLKGTQAEHYAIKTDRTSKITVMALEGIIPAHADGETLCKEGQKLEIEIVPNAIEIICNKNT